MPKPVSKHRLRIVEVGWGGACLAQVMEKEKCFKVQYLSVPQCEALPQCILEAELRVVYSVLEDCLGVVWPTVDL